MSKTRFTLVVVSTADGFIARHSGHNPADWASAEEQDLFFAKVDAADWSVMGRGTHSTADRPERRRIVFSTSAPAPEWRRPRQLWLDPDGLAPAAFAGLVGDRHPLRHGLILGGTPVHDWFLRHRAIDEVLLTVEPLRFGAGLPIFSGQQGDDPLAIMAHAGFEPVETTRLNAGGTRLIRLHKAG